MGRRRAERWGIDYVGELEEESAAHAGGGLLVDVCRQAGVGASAERVLPKNRSARGPRQEQIVEAFVVLVRWQQGELWPEGTGVRRFAVATNHWDMEGQGLLEWQRGKAAALRGIRQS